MRKKELSRLVEEVADFIHEYARGPRVTGHEMLAKVGATGTAKALYELSIKLDPENAEVKKELKELKHYLSKVEKIRYGQRI